MSPSLGTSTTASQWQAQVAEMRAAIAELGLSSNKPDSVREAYGRDVRLLEEDEADEDGHVAKGLSTRSKIGGGGIWRFVDDEDDDDDDDDDERIEFGLRNGAVGGDLDETWLRERCEEVTRKGTGGLDSEALEDQILAVLESDCGGASLRVPLFLSRPAHSRIASGNDE